MTVERRDIMNEPLKFKLFSVYGKILHKDVLTEAFRKVKSRY